jgi:hypothetical protein
MIPPTGNPAADALFAAAARQDQERQQADKLSQMIDDEVDRRLKPIIKRLDELEARLNSVTTDRR